MNRDWHGNEEKKKKKMMGAFQFQGFITGNATGGWKSASLLLGTYQNILEIL